MANVAGTVAAILREPALRFEKLGVALRHSLPGGLQVSLIRGNGGGLRFGGGHNLIVFLRRDFFFGDQNFVALKVRLRPGVVGFRLRERGGGGFAIAFGNGERGLRIGDVGFACGNVGGVLHLRDGNVRLLGDDHAAGLRELREGLIEGDLIIARIEIDQRVTGFDHLVVVDIDVSDSAVDASADGVEMRIHLGIVGGFEIAGVQPIEQSADPDDQQDEEENCESFAASAREGAGCGGGRCHVAGGTASGGGALLSFGDLLFFGLHGRFPLSRSGNAVSDSPVARARDSLARLREKRLEI